MTPVETALVAVAPPPPDDRAWRVLVMATPLLDWDALDTIRDEVTARRDYTLDELHFRFAGDSFTIAFLDDATEADCGRFLAGVDRARLRRPTVPVARSWTFSTPLDADGVLAALKGRWSYVWSIHESDYFGRYVIGRTTDGSEVRIPFDGLPEPEVELWFPPHVKDDVDARAALAGTMLALLTEALHATDVRDAP